MVELIEQLYQTNQISEEVRDQLINKHYNKQVMEKLKNIKNGQLHKHYAKIKNYLVIKDKDKARDYCDMGIAHLAFLKEDGASGTDVIEGTTINLWLERFWQQLENNGLML